MYIYALSSSKLYTGMVIVTVRVHGRVCIPTRSDACVEAYSILVHARNSIYLEPISAGDERCEPETDGEWGISWTVTAVDGMDMQNCVAEDSNAGQ